MNDHRYPQAFSHKMLDWQKYQSAFNYNTKDVTLVYRSSMSFFKINLTNANDTIDIISQLFRDEYLTPEETMSPSMVLNIN